MKSVGSDEIKQEEQKTPVGQQQQEEPKDSTNSKVKFPERVNAVMYRTVIENGVKTMKRIEVS